MSELQKILSAELKRLKPYLTKNKIEAYRLYHESTGPYPIVIDIYKDNAVIHIFERVPEDFIEELEAELKNLLAITDFFYKDRTEKTAGTPLEKGPHKEITVQEYGHTFSLNLSDYLDTGLFLDHRETRRWIESQSKNKIVLNTFAYTGSFSIYAAAGGAKKTHSVDLSKTYCEWIKKNLALNGFPPEENWVYKMDTLEFFRYAKRKQLSFDIIIIDPPTFSKNKGANFSVRRDYPELINGALELLNPNGFIVFSNNCHDFVLEKRKLRPCEVLEETTLIPPDFEGAAPHQCFIIHKP